MVVLFVCLLITQTLYAQSHLDIVTVNDRSLIEKIKKQILELKKENKVNIEQLKANIVDLKNSDKVSVSLPAANVKVLTPETIYEKCSKGTLIVGLDYNCGNCHEVHNSFSSGVILTETGICITNHHVLENLIKKDTKRDSAYYVSTVDGKVFPIIDILSYSEEADIAVFKINTMGQKLQPLSLGSPALTGSTVYALTNPVNNFYFFSTGMVSRNVSYKANEPMLNRMEITADYAKGSSGGPILDNKGNLIGIVSTTRSVYYEEKPQKNLQMVFKSVIPVSSIKTIFEKPDSKLSK